MAAPIHMSIFKKNKIKKEKSKPKFFVGYCCCFPNKEGSGFKILLYSMVAETEEEALECIEDRAKLIFGKEAKNMRFEAKVKDSSSQAKEWLMEALK